MERISEVAVPGVSDCGSKGRAQSKSLDLLLDPFCRFASFRSSSCCYTLCTGGAQCVGRAARNCMLREDACVGLASTIKFNFPECKF